MTTIVLFHSAQGLRPGVHSFADRLRAAGHVVHTPDFFDGKVFDDLDDGVAYRDQLGIPEIARRGQAAVDVLPANVVYGGFSLGTGPAQMLAQTRPGTLGAVLMHGCLPSAAFGTPWPASVPLAIHTMADDPWVDLDVARALTDEAASGELLSYPGSGHLFLDEDLPDYDKESAELVHERVLEFLDRIGG